MDMIGQDKTRDDILDKARGLHNKQCKVQIRTKASRLYQRGGKFEGYIIDVTSVKIVLHDTFVDKQIDIYASDILSTLDIWEDLE